MPQMRPMGLSTTTRGELRNDFRDWSNDVQNINFQGGKAERIIERTRLTHDIATTAPTTLTVTFHDIDTAPLFGPYQPCAEKQDA
ncbi:hypothetical protein SMACR_12878 [Sordaria macrospora]|uniref:Uncharacterized protein n=1 Tax=Sordaria macrospora TaxID=5147 RepID=A0A8S8ZHM3_SORMA|nr:hypothetical protein SMACR_12878 [Sordaria macrospora]